MTKISYLLEYRQRDPRTRKTLTNYFAVDSEGRLLGAHPSSNPTLIQSTVQTCGYQLSIAIPDEVLEKARENCFPGNLIHKLNQFP